MVKRPTPILWLIVGGICAHLSCNLIDLKSPSTNSATNSLTAGNQQPGSVTIEIFTVHLTPHQNDLLQQLWREVDEQSLPPQLRRDLLAQGFRVGVLGSFISPPLAQLLKMSSGDKTDHSSADIQEFSAADLTREAVVIRNVRSLVPEMRALVKVFDDELPELPLFQLENGMFAGQTYLGAVGLFSVSASVNKDDSAQFRIVPELEHGTHAQRTRTIVGVMTYENSKPRRSFESLTITQRLLPGQWIIMGATALDSAGMGKAFFVRQGSEAEQRLLAIRLVRTTPSATVIPNPLPPPLQGTESGIPERN